MTLGHDHEVLLLEHRQPHALVGSVVVGLIDNFGKALVPELSYFTLFAPMVIVLALRPTGLYGRA